MGEAAGTGCESNCGRGELSMQDVTARGDRAAGRNRVSVLLIEDNPGDAEFVRDFLENEPDTVSYVVTHVTRLGKALTTLAEAPTDIILLDLGLPDAGGL